MNGSQRFVCVVDDSLPFLDSFSRLLQWKGYRVVTYTGAERALEEIQQGEVDVVVADLMSPELAGLELVRSMREAGCEIPVVLMSTRVDSDVVELAKEFGVEEFVKKPFRPMEIFDVLNRAMRNGGKKRFCSTQTELKMLS
ncbi:MAG: response regulator [bacterium]